MGSHFLVQHPQEVVGDNEGLNPAVAHSRTSWKRLPQTSGLPHLDALTTNSPERAIKWSSARPFAGGGKNAARVESRCHVYHRGHFGRSTRHFGETSL